MVPHIVEDEIVTLPTLREVLLGVVNNVVCADRSNHVHIPRAANAGHLRAERLGNLHGERAHASRRTVDQDLLPWLHLPRIAKTVKGG